MITIITIVVVTNLLVSAGIIFDGLWLKAVGLPSILIFLVYMIKNTIKDIK